MCVHYCVKSSCDWGCSFLCEVVGVWSRDWGCTGLSGFSLVHAALRVEEVRHCAGFAFEVCNCLQGEVGGCRERLVLSTSWCVVFEGTLSLQVVISEERTSCDHEERFGVLCLLVQPGRSIAPVSFQLSWHVFYVNVAMSR